MEPGDIIIDGQRLPARGRSPARGAGSSPRHSLCADVGTSGGIWGIDQVATASM